MDFNGFDSMGLSASNGLGFVYVLCLVEGRKEIPFYVGETQAIWGRMNDYHWGDFQASTDFRVREAVTYLATKNLRVIAKYRASGKRKTDRTKEERAIIAMLENEGRKLLNKCRGYNYRISTPDEERIKIQKCVDEILASASARN